MDKKERERIVRAQKNFNMRGFRPEGMKPAREKMVEILRDAILESDCGASTLDAIVALDRVKNELQHIALDTTQAYRMIQDYGIDVHGHVISKE